MAQSDFICLTTDLWTHKFTMQSYLGVTAHYLQDIDMKTVELGAFPMNERKTITNLKALLRQICIQWEIPDAKISAILSDGGSIIKGAIIEEFGIYKHVSCFAHALNNIAQRVIEINVPENLLGEDEAAGFPEVPSDDENIDYSFELNETPLSPLRDIIKKVKAIVKFFKKSEIAAKELEKLQSESGQKALKLVQEVKTRWNFCYEMIDRFILLENQVGRVLMQMHTERNSRSKPPTMLTGAELDAVEDVRNVLKPLYLITKEISAEKYVTISKCIPLISGLKTKIASSNTSTLVGKSVNEPLSSEINIKFHSIEKVEAFSLATLLDPRFKKFALPTQKTSQLR
ncbi:E3 SUMO-protein ligase ZBED1-like [Musca autumnalis]|uniref:E3 SUMO-protein ligase ZBED1-like n=1 Tax=Musca autumnalis TaxID=221902 RepID=UPI003CE7FE9C